MIVNHNGQQYDITNWEDFEKQLLQAIGIQVESEITRQIDFMRLVDTGNFKQSTHFEVKENELIITNTAPYAAYLEWGTYDYFRKFGEETFPTVPDPKKKDIKGTFSSTTSKKTLTKKGLPKGMQPFAAFRRILYNQNKMSVIVDRAIKAVNK